MITEFDGVIFLGVALAWVLSSPPNRVAIAMCLGVSFLAALINMINIAPAPMLVILQASVAGLLIMYSRSLIVEKDTRFFNLMAIFLMLSAGLTAFNFNLLADRLVISIETYNIALSNYTQAFHTIAALQVLTMLIYSDGIRKIIGNIRSFIFRDHSDTRHI